MDIPNTGTLDAILHLQASNVLPAVGAKIVLYTYKHIILNFCSIGVRFVDP
jgi:hypothetical protein